MTHDLPHHGATERDLTALADGSLPAHRRVRVERAVAASPDLQACVAEQRRTLNAIARACGEHAPSSLRARLALAQPARRRRTLRFAPRRRTRRFALSVFGASTATLASVVIVAISVLVGRATAGPT